MLSKIMKIIATVFIASQIGSSIIYAESINNINNLINPSQSKSFVRKISLGTGFDDVETIQCLPEFSSIDASGKKIYKRTIISAGDFFDTRKKDKSKKIISHKLMVTFTYDKNGHVWIDNQDNDILYSKTTHGDKKWKLVHNYEILNSDSQCILSALFAIYKDPKTTRHAKYIDNSHLDIICSPDGVISFNSKSDF